MDHAIARIAERQFGLISLDQLRRLGVGKDMIYRWVAGGRMHRIHQHVYSVGHPLLPLEGEWLAATLACDSGAVLSHRSAVELWGLLPARKGRGIDVTAPNRRGRIPAGIRAHRDGSLAAVDCTFLRNIPCTSVERSLLDLARR